MTAGTWYAGCARRALAAPGLADVDGAGVGVLASLLGHLDDAALVRWLNALHGNTRAVGVFDLGRAGFVAGLTVAAQADRRLVRLAANTRQGLSGWAREYRWEPDQLQWSDYDLIAGPAGVLLALTVGGRGTAEETGPLARYLARLTAEVDLAGLRTGDNSAIDLGVGHGVPGVVLALVTAQRVLGPRPWLTAALRNCVALLVGTAATDPRGMPVWGTSDRTESAKAWQTRQAWCYGAPGVAWALWEAGDALDDPGAREVALEAVVGLDRAWDPGTQLRGTTAEDLIGVCHGAAGVLAIADAFAVHTGHPSAARLRTALTDWLGERREAVNELAAANLTLLGAAGVFAVLLTAAGGCRAWLPLLGLR
ncbi:lanthionine synthetase LanC family protein [Kibdelosporangium persicum]|uniref:Lanthionine synthetase C-like protein n=1 Tax=Kibdelosporangium persicum TaxID=2698649 RepID=A0ABX2FGB0_9PSEU|nr:lanthionine synthetase LanC family protein [Kibdelosporangium persicum]NRN70407.1 Lanthionine synthetase C-like protein [Kibdelosporangium persicum]